MTQRITGVTTNTAKRLIIDSGAIYLNYGLPDERLLGATNDGVSFTIEQEIREPDIDGLPGPLAGTRRVTSVHPRITAQLMEQTLNNLLLEIAGSAVDPDAGVDGYNVIKRAGYVIPSSAHVLNIAVVGRLSGNDDPIICMIKNALSDGGDIGFSMEDENEVQPEIQFTGHFSSDDLESEPWEIHYPEFESFTLTYTAGTNGTITGDSPQTVEEGDSGTAVTATPDEGFVFVEWDDGVQTATRRDGNILADLTVEASFEAE